MESLYSYGCWAEWSLVNLQTVSTHRLIYCGIRYCSLLLQITLIVIPPDEVINMLSSFMCICLSVCRQDICKIYGRIFILWTVSGVRRGRGWRKNRLDFGGDSEVASADVHALYRVLSSFTDCGSCCSVLLELDARYFGCRWPESYLTSLPNFAFAASDGLCLLLATDWLPAVPIKKSQIFIIRWIVTKFREDSRLLESRTGKNGLSRRVWNEDEAVIELFQVQQCLSSVFSVFFASIASDDSVLQRITLSIWRESVTHAKGNKFYSPLDPVIHFGKNK